MSMPAPTLSPPPATPSASPTATPSPSSPAAPPPQSTVPLSPVPSAPQRRRQLADDPPSPSPYWPPPSPYWPSPSPYWPPPSPYWPPPSPYLPPPPRPSSSTSTGLVAGIAIGGVVLLVVFCLLFIRYTRERRRRRKNREGYHVPPPPPPQILKANDPNGGRLPHYRQEAATPQPKLSFPTTQPPLAPPLGHRPRLPPSLSSSGGSGSNNSGAEGVYHPPSPGIVLGSSKSSFTYDEIVMATDGFSDANLLGQGGFGFVHKGVLPNGKEVAVKQLKAGSGQGEREFQAEVEIISRVHHKHLVSLVGYCMTGYQRILVYEFVPNNTLEFHLHGKGRPAMDWATRLKIALGSAKGLAYLHEDCHPTIIHRDIKAANILLDFRFEVKVADFGLAKFFSDTDTHVSTRVMGTFGYLAPEYASSGKLTEKSDVFSFGVMLLELITGRRPMDPTHSCMDDSLVDWARPQLTSALEDGNFDSLADPRLQNDYNNNEMTRMVACAAACVRHSARGRPRMSQIVRALEGNVSLSDLNEDIRPGRSGLFGSYGSLEYDAIKCNEDLKKFQKITLASTENYGSSKHGKPTSRYGVNPLGSSSEGQTSQEMEMGKMKGSSQGFT